MTRREFSSAVKKAVIRRAMHAGNVFCELCGLPAKKWQVDHVIADSHGGDPVIENAQLLCDQCYAVKNPKDTAIAAKIKRQEAKHTRAVRPKGQIKSRGFNKTEKPKDRNRSRKQCAGIPALQRQFETKE